jgi:hypothetical protein
MVKTIKFLEKKIKNEKDESKLIYFTNFKNNLRTHGCTFLNNDEFLESFDNLITPIYSASDRSLSKNFNS